MENNNILSKLQSIQQEIVVEKSRYSNGYFYRSLEDIFAGLKPLLLKHKVTIVLSDDLIEGQIMKGICKIICVESNESIEVCSFAGIDTNANKILGQAFGEASTYSKKKALSNLLLLDDGEDIDEKKKSKEEPKFDEKVKEAVAKCKTIAELKDYSDSIDTSDAKVKALIVKRKMEIEKESKEK
jgi:hypothetical protein